MVFSFYTVLRIESRASCKLGKHSTIQVQPHPIFSIFLNICECAWCVCVQCGCHSGVSSPALNGVRDWICVGRLPSSSSSFKQDTIFQRTISNNSNKLSQSFWYCVKCWLPAPSAMLALMTWGVTLISGVESHLYNTVKHLFIHGSVLVITLFLVILLPPPPSANKTAMCHHNQLPFFSMQLLLAVC